MVGHIKMKAELADWNWCAHAEDECVCRGCCFRCTGGYWAQVECCLIEAFTVAILTEVTRVATVWPLHAAACVCINCCQKRETNTNNKKPPSTKYQLQTEMDAALSSELRKLTGHAERFSVSLSTQKAIVDLLKCHSSLRLLFDLSCFSQTQNASIRNQKLFRWSCFKVSLVSLHRNWISHTACFLPLFSTLPGRHKEQKIGFGPSRT